MSPGSSDPLAAPDLGRAPDRTAELIRTSTLQALRRALRSHANHAVVLGLRAVSRALAKEGFAAALREIDRAWRTMSHDADVLAAVYARLLAHDDRQPHATLRMLQRVLPADADTTALSVRARVHLGQLETAREELAIGLARFCVKPAGLLAQMATQLLRQPGAAWPGWIARGPNLSFVGALFDDAAGHSLDIELASGATFTQLLPPSDGQGFAFTLSPALGAVVQVAHRALALFGSAQPMPDFRLDGRARGNAAEITGWARLGWRPDKPLHLRVTDEFGSRAEVKTARMCQGGYRWPFSIHPRRLGLRGERLTIAARLPDGHWQVLPDAPLLLVTGTRQGKPRAKSQPTWQPMQPAKSEAVIGPARALCTDVIIPVYQGITETLDCIESALATLDAATRIVVVDDASTDVELRAALEGLAQQGRITLLCNEINVGFAASVNRALALNPTHDAILLNSDTQVFGDWLPRLRDAAYSAAKVGTATPFSNNGSIASYPRHDGPRMDAAAACALHAIASAIHAGTAVDIPVGVGFCLYLRRDCLDEVGNLDASVFGKGYGEESDFCMRARRHGWSHRLAADVFVYHAGASSFGARRDALLDRSQRLLNLRHPGYDRFIAQFLSEDPLKVLRRRLDEKRLTGFAGRWVLLLAPANSGGIERYVRERCVAIRAAGDLPLVLRPASAGDREHCELSSEVLDLPNLRYRIPHDLEALMGVLGTLNLKQVELQHFLHLDSRLIDAVRQLRVPYDVFVHDYGWVCPRITLIDESGRYCGEPDVSVCQRCVRRNGSNLNEAISVPALRTRSAAWLRGARQVTTPSADAAARLGRYFSDLKINVLANSTPSMPLRVSSPAARGTSAVTRVALLGAIGVHKGYQVLLECARDARARNLPIEFVVIGYTENDAPLLETTKVFITGGYDEAEAMHLLRRERPDLVFLPSVWPETWCYTLDYAISSGLPMIAFDLGAMAERLRASAHGVLLPLQLEPQHINDRLLEISRTTQHEMETKMSELAPKTVESSDAPSASVQLLPLPIGVYLFSVKSQPSSNTANTLPAIRVGLAPGVAAGQVEFMEGPTTTGAWLRFSSDSLVAKVNHAGATLMVTSLRAPQGAGLSIKVERLDVAEAPRVAPAPATPVALRFAPNTAPTADPVLPLEVRVHVRSHGDLVYSGIDWAGRVTGMWIESFSIRPLTFLEIGDIECKALTGSGFETPWRSDGELCGTQGMGVPLVGFAIRLKAAEHRTQYRCEYYGYFSSGAIIGPLRNGAPCRSSVANDTLEGLHVQIDQTAVEPLIGAAPVARKSAGPQFGRYRDQVDPAAAPAPIPVSKPARKAGAGAATRRG